MAAKLGDNLGHRRHKRQVTLLGFARRVGPLKYFDHAGRLVLQHGEQRKVDLGGTRGELEVSLLVMKVDSPEFKALMDLVAVEETSRISEEP